MILIRAEGKQLKQRRTLVAINEEGKKLFSVYSVGKLHYVVTLDAPAIATVIDAGKRSEILTPVVSEHDARDLVTVSSRDASMTSQTSVFQQLHL